MEKEGRGKGESARTPKRNNEKERRKGERKNNGEEKE